MGMSVGVGVGIRKRAKSKGQRDDTCNQAVARIPADIVLVSANLPFARGLFSSVCGWLPIFDPHKAPSATNTCSLIRQR